MLRGERVVRNPRARELVVNCDSAGTAGSRCETGFSCDDMTRSMVCSAFPSSSDKAVGLLLNRVRYKRMGKKLSLSLRAAISLSITSLAIAGLASCKLFLLTAFPDLSSSSSFPTKVWQFVGSPNISVGTVGDIGIAASPGGVLCVVYQDWGPGKATAMQFVGGSWTTMGSAGFSANGISTPSVAYSSAGVPYVVYQDSSSLAANAMQFNGTSWVQVGLSGFSSGSASMTSLAIDPTTGVPYAAYSDGGASPSGATTVMKYTGNWALVPAAGRGFSGGGASYTSIAIDNTGRPYVGYSDANQGNSATVMMFNGVSWATVGSAGFAGTVAYVSLAINPVTQSPWVAFYDASAGGKITAMKYNGTNWVTVGSAGFSAGTVSGVCLKFDSNGNAFAAFIDAGIGGKAIAYQFNGTSWTSLGGAGFSPGAVDELTMAIGPNNVPYCAFRDASSFYASVMGFY